MGAQERTNAAERTFVTASSRPVDALHGPPRDEAPFPGGIGFPGEPPFTRGIQPTMYRGRLWTMRQYAGFGTAAASNERYRYLLSQGITGLSVAFDLPTQIGMDSDDPRALGEVGKVGVAIDSLADMRTLLGQIPLQKVSTSMTINAPASVLLSLYAVVAREQGVAGDQLRGTIQNDILKEYIARGTYIFPPAQSMALITDSFAYCAKHLPQWNPISVSGYHIREAGATAVQEVGLTLANGITYLQSAVDAGLDAETVAERMSFFFGAHNDLLEEVAKYRAARRLWGRLLEERYALPPRARQLRFHTQTAGCTLTAQQPEVNIVRVTIQALAAVLGGTQSLHTNALDEALALPTEKAARIALRTQQVLAHESGVANTVDPLGGSYYIEWMTDTIEEESRTLIATIESRGGMVAAIEQGWIQQQVADSSWRYQREIECGERGIVGVNTHRSDEHGIEQLRVSDDDERTQLQRLHAWRDQRDSAKVHQWMERLEATAATILETPASGAMMAAMVEAVAAGVTVGETCGALRRAWGEYVAPQVF